MYLARLDEIGMKDIKLVGGKACSLGEMIQKIPNVKIPPGFVLTTKYYNKFIKYNNLKKTISELLSKIDHNDINTLNYYGNLIRKKILYSNMPSKYINDILEYYNKLGNNASVAVRSSSTAEDLDNASFAGQQDTYLNIQGIENILFAIKRCFASLYTDRAISYRHKINYTMPLDIAVCIQLMIRSDKGCSGVAFSLDPETGFQDIIVINGSYGLGESIVQGKVLPDEFIVYKNTLKLGYEAIIDKKLGIKNQKTIYRENHGIEQIDTLDDKTFCLSDGYIILLSKWILDIEEYYKCPMDIEWAFDSENLYIVQARPETIHSNKKIDNLINEYIIEKHDTLPILSGVAVGNKITSGEIKIIDSITNYDLVANFKKGDVLVTDITDPDWEPLMKNASAIITNKGGRTCFQGDTKILTNKGIMKISDVFYNSENTFVPSINRDTLKIEWKKVEYVMKKNSETIRVYVNDDEDDYLDITPDHKMINIDTNTNINTNKINDISVSELINLNLQCTCLQYLPKYLKHDQDKIYLMLEEIIDNYLINYDDEYINLKIKDYNNIKKLIYLCLRLRIKYKINYIKNKYLVKLSKIDNFDYYFANMNSNFKLEKNWVYNITVQDNHNYVVFTNNYNPILVNNCHASIIARELGINALVGTKNGLDILSNYMNDNNDNIITVSCAEGEIGYVYPSEISYKQNQINIDNLPIIKTKIMLNIASPINVFKYYAYPQISGVGLVREEFIINNYIQIHPLALIHYDKLDKETQDKINNIVDLNINSYTDYYINKLSYGIARIAATFYPRDVIVRFSDFKSNEYKNLLGGKFFEPCEENPMIGWRGASRYYSPDFIEAFKLECKAINKVRNVMGLKNVIVMIPFCRTTQECINIINIMKSEGLNKEDGLKIYIMCEIPSNVILASKFCKYVDGFSIGSNDLTQLTLGLDRDSELVSHIYKETDLSVKYMIKKAIKACKKNNVKIGICGQGPSDNPKFAQFLVKHNIDSISIVPDSLIKTILAIHKVEKKLAKNTIVN